MSLKLSHNQRAPNLQSSGLSPLPPEALLGDQQRSTKPTTMQQTSKCYNATLWLGDLNFTAFNRSHTAIGTRDVVVRRDHSARCGIGKISYALAGDSCPSRLEHTASLPLGDQTSSSPSAPFAKNAVFVILLVNPVCDMPLFFTASLMLWGSYRKAATVRDFWRGQECSNFFIQPPSNTPCKINLAQHRCLMQPEDKWLLSITMDLPNLMSTQRYCHFYYHRYQIANWQLLGT